MLCLASARAAAGHLDVAGFTDLQSRLGTNLATGAGVAVAQIEAPDGTNYLANTNLFLGKVFTPKSGPTAFSGHATAVGGYFYGENSMAPGTTNVQAYEADGFIYADGLRSGSSNVPLDPSPARVLNHSWIGGDTNPPTSAAENDILQRMDHVIDAFGATAVAGINNGNGPLDYPLLSQAYNAIAVGVSGGTSRSGPAFADTAGRAKPDIVAPVDLTSWGAAIVSGAATLLIDRSRSLPALTNAADPRLVKAQLLNTAAKPPGWHKGDTNNSDDMAVPLDWRYGAGELRINRAYDLLNAGEVAPGTQVTNSAWDLGTTPTGRTNWYFFSLDPTRHESLKATLVWHRHVQYQKIGPFLNVTTQFTNLNLLLHTASGTNPVAIISQSTSLVDNVEHMWFTNVTAGGFALAVAGPPGETYGLGFDAVPVPLMGITAPDTNAAEFGADPATFMVRRDGSAELAITVNLGTSGVASNGTDYTMPPTVTLTAGQTIASVTLAPILDTLAEGPEPVTVAIATGPGYAISATNQATATIADRPVDQWRFDNFTAEELSDPSISGDGADPDGDGPNLVEYDSGDSPKLFHGDATGRAHIISDSGSEYLSLTFQRKTPPSDVTSIVELSGNLINWASNSIQVGSPIPGTNGTETVTFRDTVPLDDAERRFIRRWVERVIAP